MAKLIHHVDLAVNDMARARAFYGPVMSYLGYETTQETPRHLVFASIEDGSCPRVALRKLPLPLDSAHNSSAPGLHLLSFEAESREDVDGLYAFLREIGAAIIGPAAADEVTGRYGFAFADPEGIRLEFTYPQRDCG